MQQFDLHQWDEELWQAPQVRLSQHAYTHAWAEFGGHQNSDSQKVTILHALLCACKNEDVTRATVLVKLLEVGYGVDRSEMPKLLLELQTKVVAQ